MLMTQENPPVNDEFAKLYAAEQSRLFAFIYSLVGSHDLASDVLQNTNVVIWQKRDQFTPGTDFIAWALRIARYEVMAMRKKRSRDLLVFSDEFVSLIADKSVKFNEQFDERQAALEQCMDKLPANQSELLRQRYMHGHSVKAIAKNLNRSANAIAVQIHRIRAALSECIEHRLNPGKGDVK